MNINTCIFLLFLSVNIIDDAHVISSQIIFLSIRRVSLIV